MMSLFAELKRRNVFRVAIAYLAAAWLLTEVASTVFPLFGVPEWGARFLVVTLALGFLPALIFSWVYELTPEGLKREKNVARDASITHLTGRRLDLITIGLVLVALLFVAVEPVIEIYNYRAAIDLALVLQRRGESARAERLLAGCEAFIRTRPRLGWWGGYWISDVQILTLRGRKTEALAALRRAVDEGWRALWWYYLQSEPNLEPIRDEPEFEAIRQEIETEMAARMERIRGQKA